MRPMIWPLSVMEPERFLSPTQEKQIVTSYIFGEGNNSPPTFQSLITQRSLLPESLAGALAPSADCETTLPLGSYEVLIYYRPKARGSTGILFNIILHLFGSQLHTHINFIILTIFAAVGWDRDIHRLFLTDLVARQIPREADHHGENRLI